MGVFDKVKTPVTWRPNDCFDGSNFGIAMVCYAMLWYAML
jgi:hypothetical protein